MALAFAVVTFSPSAAAAAEEDVPTFTKDVAPIFQAKCEACHRAGSIAPMSLVTYQESRPWARSIRERVSTRQMPPWHLDRTVGITEFKNDRSLTQDQIDVVVAWVDGGSPMGNPADMPAPVEWPDESIWNFAELFGGPGEVIFNSEQSEGAEPEVIQVEFEDLDGGEAAITATFSEPGEYRLMVTANDISGDGVGGDQCCWTTGFVDVTVTP